MRTTTCILLLISISAGAQQAVEPDGRPRMSYGLVLGGNLTKATSDGQGSHEPRLGFRAGLSANYELSTHFFLQGSVAFLKERYYIDYGTFGGAIPQLEVIFKYSWIEMPITVNYNFLRKKQTSVFAGAGASPRLLLDYGGSGKSSNYFYVIDNVNDWNIFGVLQLGVATEAANGKRFGSTINYQVNALKLHQPGSSSGSDTDSKLNSINLTLWFVFSPK